jgi:hypothetical protein
MTIELGFLGLPPLGKATALAAESSGSYDSGRLAAHLAAVPCIYPKR